MPHRRHSSPLRGFPCRVDFCPSRTPHRATRLRRSRTFRPRPPTEGNLWVAPVDDFGSASRLTKSARPLLDFGWTYDGRHLLFSDDTSGEENHRIWAITHDTADAYMLTPENRDAARRRAISPDRPDTIVAGLNDRDAAWHEAWTIDLASGRRDRVFENRGGTASECSTMPCRSVYWDARTRNRAVHRSTVTMPA